MRKIALITGANQGLGFALAQGLARAWGDDGLVYLGARDIAKGDAAVSQLKGDGLSVTLMPIDVTEPASVAAAAESIQRMHGGIDVVLSNAAARIVREKTPGEQVRLFVDTNNFGERRMIESFRDLLRARARFLVVASSFGSLRHLDPSLHERFDVARASLDDIDAEMRDYVAVVEEGRAAAEGWPDWINVPSKVGQVAAMKIFAREMVAEASAREVFVAAVCPGLVDTDASRPWFADMSQAQTPDAAAVPIVAIATGEAGVYGELNRLGTTVPWV
ncbi:MAG: SDR family NAD(P)-dependent oxidoreductase [Alphaproteobacteria bacterium]|nr:SDR family NAD(P)-dependent oxidoreductase [Alphaproteobacteria bacterium]